MNLAAMCILALPPTAGSSVPIAGPLPPAPVEARAGYSFMLRFGSQSMSDSTAWEGIDQPIALGLDFASHGTRSQFGPEYGLGIAGDGTTVAGIDVSSFFVELYGGARYTWDVGEAARFHPYLGAGLAYIFASVDGAGLVSDDDSSLGGYVHGGAFYRLGDSFCLGIDARVVGGTSASLFGVETDLDYFELALTLGWGR